MYGGIINQPVHHRVWSHLCCHTQQTSIACPVLSCCCLILKQNSGIFPNKEMKTSEFWSPRILILIIIGCCCCWKSNLFIAHCTFYPQFRLWEKSQENLVWKPAYSVHRRAPPSTIINTDGAGRWVVGIWHAARLQHGPYNCAIVRTYTHIFPTFHMSMKLLFPFQFWFY